MRKNEAQSFASKMAVDMKLRIYFDVLHEIKQKT